MANRQDISKSRPDFQNASALLNLWSDCGERKGNRDGYFCTRVRRWNDRGLLVTCKKVHGVLGR